MMHIHDMYTIVINNSKLYKQWHEYENYHHYFTNTELIPLVKGQNEHLNIFGKDVVV